MDNDHPHDCTVEEMTLAVDGYLTVDVLSYGVGSEAGVAGIVSVRSFTHVC